MLLLKINYMVCSTCCWLLLGYRPIN